MSEPNLTFVYNLVRKKTLRREAAAFTMDNQSLDCVPFITDLGVTVSNDLSWSKHIENIVPRLKNARSG